MSRLPRVTAREALAAMERAGFKIVRASGSHHHLSKRGHPGIVTVPLHGGTLEVGLLHSILRQAGLTPEEFQALL